MSKDQKRVPELRFKGFSDDWELCKLGEILKVNSGKDYKHLEKGKIPVYGTGGYMLSVNKSLSDRDAIGIGRKGTINNPQLLKSPFWTVDTLFYMTIKEKSNLFFSYWLAKSINWKKYDESTGVPSLSKNTIDKVAINIPTLNEQIQIGNFLQQIQHTITLHQRKLELLKQMKQGFLQVMFPEKGITVPKLRFANFDGEWEQRKTKYLCSISTGKSNTQDKNDEGQYPFYVRSATIEKSTKYLYDEEAVLTVGDGVGTGKVYHYVIGKYDIHQRVYRMFDFVHGVSAKYFYYFFSNNFYRRVQAMTAKTSVDSVRLEMIADMKVNFPSLEEQNQISSFFDNLEYIITNHQTKLHKIQSLKKAFLQKMFI